MTGAFSLFRSIGGLVVGSKDNQTDYLTIGNSCVMITKLEAIKDYITMMKAAALEWTSSPEYTDEDLENLQYWELQSETQDTITLARWHDLNIGAPTQRDIEGILGDHGFELEHYLEDVTAPHTWVKLCQWMGY